MSEHYYHRPQVQREGSMPLLIAAMDQAVDKICVDCGADYNGARISKRCPVCRVAAAERLTARALVRQKRSRDTARAERIAAGGTTRRRRRP